MKPGSAKWPLSGVAEAAADEMRAEYRPEDLGPLIRGKYAARQARARSMVVIDRCESVDQPGWLPLRKALWPDAADAEHRAEMAAFLNEPERFIQLVAHTSPRQPVAFVEASVRHDWVNGTSTSPVVFLEGLYVATAYRRSGVATRLVDAVAAWGRAQGCSEFASDTALDNVVSQAVHRSLGFQETERVVYFRREL